jgi:hypothetical protein
MILGNSALSTILASLLFLCSCPIWAKQVFFPTPKPTLVPIGGSDIPGWLSSGNGDDGYLKIEVASSMKNGCVPLGDAGFLGLLSTQKIQLTVTIKLSNISSALQGREIPIAILDGRSNPGSCLPLTILDAGMTLVPLARLERFTAGVNSPRIELFVRSTSESKINLVGPAQALLGVATVFATGGAASTVAGLTSALAQPAFKQIERAWDNANSGLTPGLSGETYSWQQLRGVKKLVFPVFTDKTGGIEDDASGIPRLQNDGKVRNPEFTIELLFSHFPTAFDLTTNKATGLPTTDDVSPSTVFGHPNQAGVPTVAQLIEQEVSALSKATDDRAVRDACNLLVNRVKSAGFALKDRAMQLYTAMSKARSANWYVTELDNCANDLGPERETIRRIWGNSSITFQYLDARKRFADQDESYSVWFETGVPVLESLRKALIEQRLDERERLIKKLSAGSEIEFDAPAGPDEWPAPAATNPEAHLPKLQRLAARKMVGAGCFTYRAGNAFSPSTNPGDFLLLDEKDRVWVVSPRRSAGDVARLASVEIFAIDDNWKSHYSLLVRGGYYGSPVRGGCAHIISKLQ